MKQKRIIKVNNKDCKIEIVLKQEKEAKWNSIDVKREFEHLFDDIVQLLGNHFNFKNIKY